MSYIGGANVTLDAKGRIAVPTKYRDDLMEQCAGRLVITLGLKWQALILPVPVYDKLEQQLASMPGSRRVRQRVIFGAERVEMDSGGRILVPAPMRERGLFPNQTLSFVGNITHFELWDTEKLNQYDAASYEDSIADVSEDFLQSFDNLVF